MKQFNFFKPKEILYKKSYSQCGEDMIIDFVITNHFHIDKPTYIDIGAHDPYYLSNTAYFYEKGCRGINIEPNPVLFEKILKHRQEDICLNIGISHCKETLPFYVLNVSTMSTFSLCEMDLLIDKYGFKHEKTLSVCVSTFLDVITEYADSKCPDILFLDAEGYEDIIIKSIDFSFLRPKIICIESAKYDECINLDNKEHNLEEYLISQNYKVYADTFVNTILIDVAITD